MYMPTRYIHNTCLYTYTQIPKTQHTHSYIHIDIHSIHLHTHITVHTCVNTTHMLHRHRHSDTYYMLNYTTHTIHTIPHMRSDTFYIYTYTYSYGFFSVLLPWFSQALSVSNPAPLTFRQRYFGVSTRWGGALSEAPTHLP